MNLTISKVSLKRGLSRVALGEKEVLFDERRSDAGSECIEGGGRERGELEEEEIEGGFRDLF